MAAESGVSKLTTQLMRKPQSKLAARLDSPPWNQWWDNRRVGCRSYDAFRPGWKEADSLLMVCKTTQNFRKFTPLQVPGCLSQQPGWRLLQQLGHILFVNLEAWGAYESGPHVCLRLYHSSVLPLRIGTSATWFGSVSWVEATPPRLLREPRCHRG